MSYFLLSKGDSLNELGLVAICPTFSAAQKNVDFKCYALNREASVIDQIWIYERKGDLLCADLDQPKFLKIEQEG